MPQQPRDGDEQQRRDYAPGAGIHRGSRWLTIAQRVGALCVAALAAGCVGDELALSPGELDTRDLLGISASVALEWDDDQRADARVRLLAAAPAAVVGTAPLGVNPDRDVSVRGALHVLDHRLREGGEPPVLLARADVVDGELAVEPVVLDGFDVAPVSAVLDLVDWDLGRRGGWETVAAERPALVTQLAVRAGHDPALTLRVVAAPQQPFGAVYVADPPTLLLNPLLVAVADAETVVDVPGADSDPAAAVAAVDEEYAAEAVPSAAATSGNPYSFYGSVGECAAAQRLRCDACVPTGVCSIESRDATDGVTECNTLGADNGRGYYLFCVNLSLAIATVADCAADQVPSCPAVPSASNQLAALEANAVFVDDSTCGGGLDICLSRIYGEPSNDFPPPPTDAGPPPPPPPPPRDTDISCGDTSCEFNPQCSSSCGGSSCDNNFSCGDCDSGGGGGGGGGDSGGCDCGGSDDGGGGGDGGGCGGSDDGGGDGGSCDSGGDCGSCDSGGDCGSCDSSCSSGSSEGSSSNSCGNCSVASPHRATWSAVLALAWAFLPLPLMGWWARRERRREEDDE